MSLFSRKPASAAPSAQAEYRLMLDLDRARVLAGMIAQSRAAKVIEIGDLLAGMYISNWERLCRYWRGENHDHVEEFLRGICQISPQRWNAWITHYDGERQKANLPRWKTFLTRSAPEETSIGPSASLTAVLKEAEGISPFRDTLNGHSIPILTSESVLLSMARIPGSEIAKKLVASGLDAEKLEREARNPRGAAKN